MEIKLDRSICYAIALEGGGAKGGYEIGVWKALDEAGIKYNAVSGTSVGALNGALYAIGDLQKAVDAWADMTLSKVIGFKPGQEDDFKKLVSGKLELKDVKEIAPEALEIVKNKGLDVSPLKAWINRILDEGSVKKIQSGDIDLYVTTVNISDKKGQIVHMQELGAEEMANMFLASAYHPTFKLEKLGDKLYADGGFIDSLPIYPLVKAGYKNIIAVHIPGIGNTRHFQIPEDVSVHHIIPAADLGGALNFDSRQAIEDMTWGYMDAKRLIYGLAGTHYYIDRSLDEKTAMDTLAEICTRNGASLREAFEKKIPAFVKKAGLKNADYYDILLAYCELLAEEKGIKPWKVYKDTDFMAEVFKQQLKQ